MKQCLTKSSPTPTLSAVTINSLRLWEGLSVMPMSFIYLSKSSGFIFFRVCNDSLLLVMICT